MQSEQYSKASGPNDTLFKESQFQDFVKRMLLRRLFIGTFQEKRYVDPLKSYRDVIVISKEETELIQGLQVVLNRIRNNYGFKHWVGITTPDTVGAPVGYCLWVELSEEVFGSYWYKISQVKFRPHETLLRLKIIRPISNVDTNAASTFKESAKPEDLPHTSMRSEFNIYKVREDLTTSFKEQLKNAITVENTVEAVKLLSLILVALSAGFIKFIEFVADFSIKLTKEISSLIQVIVPIILACINLIGKIVGGFYILVLHMWRDRKGPPPHYVSPYVIRRDNVRQPYDQYNTVYYRRGFTPAIKPGGAKLTPLD